jgi:cytochrome P450
MTIFLAGHETTANALTWTFYLLSQNPTVETKLYEELCYVLGNGKDSCSSSTNNITTTSKRRRIRIPTIKDVPKLEYTEKVFRESMRLYPPAWTIGRQAINDFKVDKYVIRAGSIILMSQYVMHRNPRYFSDPELFYPDRWTKEAVSELPRFSYFPFGGGIRGCIGEPFAWMEGILLLATICQQWKMHHNDTNHNKVELKPLITLRPKHGMPMKLERRK